MFLHRSKQNCYSECKATSQWLSGKDSGLPRFPHQDPNNPGPIASQPLQCGIKPHLLPNLTATSTLELAFQGPLSYVLTCAGSLKDSGWRVGGNLDALGCSPDVCTFLRQDREALSRAHSSRLAPYFSTVSHTCSSVISRRSSRLSWSGEIS